MEDLPQSVPRCVLCLLALVACTDPGGPRAADGPCAAAMSETPVVTGLAELEVAFANARGVVPELDGVAVTLTPADSETDYFYSNLELATLNDPPLERSYLAFYNPRLFDDPPTGAAVAAILVHELAHVLDYTALDGPGLAQFGLWYATEDVAEYERETDLFAMERGCAAGLVDYREWLYLHIPPEAVADKVHDYWTPAELHLWSLRH